MKIMPRYQLRFMRFLVERMLTKVTAWEDWHADGRDYRMSYLSSGLWQASQSMRQILDGEFNPMRKYEGLGTVGKAWMTDQQLGDHYTAELFGTVPVPMRPAD